MLVVFGLDFFYGRWFYTGGGHGKMKLGHRVLTDVLFLQGSSYFAVLILYRADRMISNALAGGFVCCYTGYT